ncbi:MAG: Fur family transcriptional regulator [Terrabacter sp.]
MTNPPQSARVAEAVERLRAVGERLTPARYAVLQVVDAADGTDEHLTADDIGARVGELEPAVHRATVYRTLTSLVDSGVLSHVHLGGAATVYHLTARPAAEKPEHADHAHVQCHVCGKVMDVAPEVFDDVAARLRDDLGFVLDTGHAALLGTCRDCAP